MKLELPMTLLALALCAAWGSAQATDAIVHNDLDGDRHSDLIWRNASTGAVVYWSAANAARSVRVQVTKTYGTPIDFSLAGSTIAFACTLWSATYADLVAENGKGDLIGMMLDSRPGNYSAYIDSVVSPDWTLVGVGDFTNSSWKMDFVLRNRRDGSNMIGFWGWDSRQFVPLARVPDLAWNIVGIGDFDGDGASDLLWRHASNGRNAIWRSGNVATSLAIGVVRLDWKVATVGDFNGDGRSDILWRNARTGANTIWRSGSSLTPQAVTGVTNLAWTVVASDDYDGDGKWDLLWRNSATGANVIWKSANAATQQALPTVTNQAWTVVP